MGYKLLCIDLDGTLLPSNHHISHYTIETLKKANEKGVTIVISTGRSFTDSLRFAELIGVKTYIIAANGAYVREQDSNDIIYKNILDEESVWKIIEVCSKYNITPGFHTIDKIIHGDDFGRFIDMLKQRAKDLGKEPVMHTAIYAKDLDMWKEIIAQEKDNIMKSEIYFEDAEVIKKIKEDLRALDQLEVVGSLREEQMEVNAKGTSKGRAIEILSGLLNIRPEEIMAIGDGENDITMIEFAGLGIAMGNAKDALKEIADYVTESNDEDGVAKAIDKFILNN